MEELSNSLATEIINTLTKPIYKIIRTVTNSTVIISNITASNLKPIINYDLKR